MALVLSLMVLADVTLLIGAIVLWRRGDSRKQAVLMLVLVVVIAANIALMTVPDTSGNSPLGHELN